MGKGTAKQFKQMTKFELEKNLAKNSSGAQIKKQCDHTLRFPALNVVTSQSIPPRVITFMSRAWNK